MIFTSYFANIKNVDKSRKMFSIARYTPKGIAMPHFYDFAPSHQTLELYKNGQIDEKEYEKRYRAKILSFMNPQEVARKFSGGVFFCYERPEDFCHRKIVRKWLAENGIFSLEYKRKYKIAVVGSRSYDNKKEFFAIMSRLVSSFDESQKLEIVSGGAKGADFFAREFALANEIPITEILPDWDRHGKSAGFVRNREIWEEADFGIAFWDGASKGTAHSFELAKQLEKTIVVYNFSTKKFSVLNFEKI